MSELTWVKSNAITRALVNILPQSLRIRTVSIYSHFKGWLYFNHYLKKQLTEREKSHLEKGKILFLYADGVRDKLDHSLVISKLEDRYWIESCHLIDHASYVTVFKPHLLVIPEVYSDATKPVCSFARKTVKGVKILALQGEGIIPPYTEVLWGSGVLSDWDIVKGEGAKKVLLKHGRSEEKIFVCGCTRFDRYYHKMFISRDELCRQLGLEVNKKIALYGTGIVTDSPYRKKYFPDYPFEKMRRLRVLILATFLNVAKRHPEIQFVIKVHPVEVDDIYSKMVKEKGVKNCIVIGKMYEQEDVEAQDIVPNVDLIIHWASTISIDAWISGKPTISCQFLDVREILDDFVYGSEIVENEEQLEMQILRLLENPVMSEEKRNLQQQFIEKWFYKVNGKASERVAQIIEQLIG